MGYSCYSNPVFAASARRRTATPIKHKLLHRKLTTVYIYMSTALINTGEEIPLEPQQLPKAPDPGTGRLNNNSPLRGIVANIRPDEEHVHAMAKESTVWDVYNNEARKVDNELVKDWTASLNLLLVFVSQLLLIRSLHSYSHRRLSLRPCSPHLSSRARRCWSQTRLRSSSTSLYNISIAWATPRGPILLDLTLNLPRPLFRSTACSLLVSAQASSRP